MISPWDFVSPSGATAGRFTVMYWCPQAPSTSKCSSCVVDGNTTSAKRAVSVRKCSSTTVNRSSRARPRRTRPASGCTTAGFVPQIIRPCTGGPSDGSVSVSPSLRHVQKPRRRTCRDQVGPLGFHRVDLRRGLDEHAAAAVTPVPAEHCKRMQRANESFAVRALLRPDAGADEGRSRLRELARKPHHGLRVDPAHLGHAIRRPWRDRCRDGIEIGAGAACEVEVRKSLLEHHAGHARGENGVGAGTERDVLVALPRRPRADRVEADHPRAMTPARLLDEMPVMMAGRQDVDAPQQDQAAVHGGFGVEAERQAFLRGLVGGDVADAAADAACAECVEEPHRAAKLHDPHRAEIAVRQQRLRAVRGCDGGETLGHQIECRIPRDALELSGALRTDPAQRMKQPVGCIGPGRIVVDLGAERRRG